MAAMHGRGTRADHALERAIRLRRLAPNETFEVAGGGRDPRGWSVRDRDGRVVGRVYDLVVEVDSRTVRYLEVMTKGEGVREGSHVALPMGWLWLHGDADVVTLPTLSRRDVLDLPPLGAGAFTREAERELLTRFGGPDAVAAPGERFYERAAFTANAGPKRARTRSLTIVAKADVGRWRSIGAVGEEHGGFPEPERVIQLREISA